MIEPRYQTLQALFAERVFRIPPYQRFYSWQTKQRRDFFGDLNKLAGAKEDQHHFMATVVCHKTSEIMPIGTAQYRLYDVVDGQQRLTTIIILLKCIEMSLPEGSDDRVDLGRILVKRDGHLILLQTNNANAHIFNRFLREGTLPKPEEIRTHSDKTLQDALSECQQFLNTWTVNRKALDLMRLILHRLGFVVYDTEDGRVVYTLFEVLNSRGLVVDWLDKAKSVLMGRASELAASALSAQAAIENLQSIWTNIYLELAKEDVSGDEVLRVTSTLYYGPGQGKPQSAEDSLRLIREKCTSASSPSQISERLLSVARKLSNLNARTQLDAVTEILQARLLAVALLIAEGVDEQERRGLLDQWERITFRIFVLFGRDSRTKVGDFVRLGFEIVTSDIKSRTYNQIMGKLKKLGSEFPIDDAVKAGLIGKDIYDESPEACRYLLWNYEEHLAKSAGTNATIDEHDRAAIWKLRAVDSLEHIHPQNPGSADGWSGKLVDSDGLVHPINEEVGRIGNLLLMPSPLNSTAKTHSFADKKRIYAQHNLRSVREVCAREDWNLAEITTRETAIVEWARTRWADI